MNKSAFIELIKKPVSAENKQLKELEALTADFPFCQLGHQLLAKAHHDQDTSLSSDKIKVASVYSSNRRSLRDLIRQPLEGKSPVTSPEISKPKAKVEKVEKVKPVDKATASDEKENEAPIATSVEDTQKPEPAKEVTTPEVKPEPVAKKEPEETKKVTIEVKEETQIEKPTDTPAVTTPEPDNKDEIKIPSSVVEKKLESAEEKKTPDLSIEFHQPSNFDYLGEISNINLKNLIPPSETSDTASELPDLENLIPDGLNMIFGIRNSRYGEALYSTSELEKAGNEDLILTNSKTEPEPSADQIIDTFIRNQPKISTLKDIKPISQEADLSKKKVRGLDNSVTETMANIYLAQGSIKKAKNIFEKLMVQFPEKKAYFAKKLRDIKE